MPASTMERSVKLELIGGRYSAEQRVRIMAWCSDHFASMPLIEPVLDCA